MDRKPTTTEVPGGRRFMEAYGPERRGAVWRLALSLVTGLTLIGSAFTPWGHNHKAYNIGADSLLTSKATVNASFTTSIGLVVLVLGVLALVGLIPRRGWLTMAAGIGGLIVALEFLITHIVRADFPRSELDFGWYLLLLSILAIPAAFVGTRPEPAGPSDVTSGVGRSSNSPTRRAPTG